MKMATTPALLVLTFLVAGVPEARAQHATMTDLELMTDLKGAAPQSVVEQATIMSMGSDNKRPGREQWMDLHGPRWSTDVCRQSGNGLGKGLAGERSSAAEDRIYLHAEGGCRNE
jgi:hypothetical protein